MRQSRKELPRQFHLAIALRQWPVICLDNGADDLFKDICSVWQECTEHPGAESVEHFRDRRNRRACRR
jgi:hypothetical protein